MCWLALGYLLPYLVPALRGRTRPLPCDSLSSDILRSGMATTGICQGQLRLLGLDRAPTCLGFPSALDGGGWGREDNNA